MPSPAHFFETFAICSARWLISPHSSVPSAVGGRKKRENNHPGDLHDLFPQMSPVCSPGISATNRASRHGHDLIDLAARDFDFDTGIQQLWGVHDELER